MHAVCSSKCTRWYAKFIHASDTKNTTTSSPRLKVQMHMSHLRQRVQDIHHITSLEIGFFFLVFVTKQAKMCSGDVGVSV